MGNVPTVEQMLFNPDKVKIASGEEVTGREYLDGAIKAYGLKPCDYFTAHHILMMTAKGNDASGFVEKIKQFWATADETS